MTVTYCIVADVRKIVDANDSGRGVTSVILANEQVELHINRAENLINAYVGAKYTVPFVSGSIPPLINTICIDIAAYYVFVVLFTRDSVNRNDWVEEWYTRHIDVDNQKDGTLDKIRDGKLPVLLDDGTEAPIGTAAIKSNTQNYIPTFDEGSVLGWEPDPNKITDIENSKE
jgi:phage gp36-like protein